MASVYDEVEDNEYEDGVEYDEEVPEAEPVRKAPVQEEAEEPEDEFYEIDQKIALVSYYRKLTPGVFNDGSEEGELVNRELAKWAKEQVRICMGHQPPMAHGFTKEEVDKLKKLLPLVEKLPGLISQLGTKLQVAAPMAVQAPTPVVQAPRPVVQIQSPTPVKKAVKKKDEAQPATPVATPKKKPRPYVRPKSGTVVPKNHKISSKSETEYISGMISAKSQAIKNNNNAISQGLQSYQQNGDVANATGAHLLLKDPKEE